MGADEKVTMKNGYQVSKKKLDENKRMKAAIRNDYDKLRLAGHNDEDARKIIQEKRQVGTKLMNIALNTGAVNAKTAVELSARAMVLQEREQQAMEQTLDQLDSILATVLEMDDDAMIPVEVTDNAGKLITKMLPKGEYVLLKLKDKGRVIKETLETYRTLRGTDNTVNVNIDQRTIADRMREGFNKFGVEIKETTGEEITE